MAFSYSYAKLNSDPDFTFDYGSAFDYTSICKRDATNEKRDYKSAFTYHSFSSCEENLSVKETWLSTVARNAIFWVSCTFALLLFPISIFVCIKRVHSLERLVVSRLGKLQPIKGPGFVLVLPFVDQWTKVDLHPKRLTVSTPQILTADGGIVEVTAEVDYCVSDVLHYVVRSGNPLKSLQELSQCCLVNMATGKDQEDLEKTREAINENLKVELNNIFVKWGVEIVNITLNPIKILKAAEPVSAINTIMSALKTVAEQPTFNPACAVIANQIPASESTSEPPAEKPELCNGNSHIIPVLRHFVSSSVKKDKIKGLSAIFKLEILGVDPKCAYIILCDGDVSVIEGINSENNPDVSVIVPEDVLHSILTGKKSAIEAYFEGKITVSGNSALLNTLSELLS